MPIVLVETLFFERRTIPWLGRLGLGFTGILFVIGIAATTIITLSADAFVAPVSQLASAVVAIIILVVIAFWMRPALPKPVSSTRPAPNVWLVGAFSLAAGSIFMLIPHPSAWWMIPVILYLVLYAIVIALVRSWSRRFDWGDRHRLALASGALLTYA